MQPSAATGATRSSPTRWADPCPRAGCSSLTGRAVVEAAAAIGLPLLAAQERDPLVASSRGLGELVLAALAGRRRRRSSSDSAGARRWTAEQGLREVLRELSVPTTVLCDVRTTLGDAARLFGPAERRVRGGRRRARASARGDDGARALCRAAGLRRRWRTGGGLRRPRRRARARRIRGARPRRVRRAGCATPISSSRARARSTRRRRKGRRRASSPRAAPRRACAASCSAAASCVALAGVETVALSGDRARRARGPRSARRQLVS